MEITVFLADDHPISRKGLADIISENKNLKIVGEAGDGETSLSLILKLKPDIAILDINMPKLNGFDVVHALRKEKLKTKIIFITLHKEENIFRRAIEIGVMGYVVKESALEDILECIEAVINHKHYISPQLSDFLLQVKDQSNTDSTLALLKKLTVAELTILKLISEKKTSQEIAEKLFISVRTVENHRSNICKKLELHGVNSLIKFAIENRNML